MSKAPTHLNSILPSTRSRRSAVVRQLVLKSTRGKGHTILDLGSRRLCIPAVDENLVYAIVVGTGHEALHVAIVRLVSPLTVTVSGDVFESVDSGPGAHSSTIGAGYSNVAFVVDVDPLVTDNGALKRQEQSIRD